MTKRPRSCARPFVLITTGLFLFTGCHVMDADDRQDRRCRADTASTAPASTPLSRTGGCKAVR